MKKVALYLNQVASYPNAELHASQLDEFKSDDLVNIFTNSWQTRFTHNNPLGRPMSFLYERKRALTVCEFLGYKLNNVQVSNKNDQKEISAETFKRLELGVMSSIASYLRITQEDHLTRRWKRIKQNLLKNSLLIYKFFQQEFQNNYDEVLLFNGRFCEDVACKRAAQEIGIDFKVYDFKKAGSYYEFRNVALHNVEENCKRAKNYFLENTKRAKLVANTFISNKVLGIETYEKSYTAHQKDGILDKFLVSIDEKIIALYPSSDDEYRFLADDWGVEGVEDQVQEIKAFADDLENEYLIIVRLHPNMYDMHKKLYNDYLELDKMKNVKVIKADSELSTYELLKRSEIVVSFMSTIGAEATFLGKPSIGIGGSPYSLLPIVNIAKSGKHAAKMIKERKFRVKSKTSAIIWMNYLWKYSQYNRFINETSSSDNNARGSEFKFKLRSVRFYRLLAAYERLELQLQKGQSLNKKTLRNMFNAVRDTFLDRSSNKV
tara:strand:+ start:390 stop:1862 length:1473 start_codon:yes stop_codon:yes gene_type:complete